MLILPQRQTGVVAKQAAEVDILSGGRLRLGIGVGWNHVEYEALGMEWKTRGAHQAEQVEVMRKLWTEDQVTFKGRFHNLVDVTMLPVPVQRPIPIWFGGSSDAVIKRAARIGDGWMDVPIMAPDVAEPKLATLREHLKSFGRDPASFGLEGWLRMDTPDEEPLGQGRAGLEASWRRDGDALSDVPDGRARPADRDPAALQGSCRRIIARGRLLDRSQFVDLELGTVLPVGKAFASDRHAEREGAPQCVRGFDSPALFSSTRKASNVPPGTVTFS